MCLVCACRIDGWVVESNNGGGGEGVVYVFITTAKAKLNTEAVGAGGKEGSTESDTTQDWKLTNA